MSGLIGPPQLDPLGEEEGSAALLSDRATHNQGTSTPKAHTVGSVTERPGVMGVPHFLGGYTRSKELSIMLPSLILYSTYSQDSDPCPGNTHGLKGFRLGLLLNSKEEILLR